MGWANCGKDSRGRKIGYAILARCDEPGCHRRIDRGLSYACGGVHGTGEGCEGYFCGKHLRCVLVEEDHPMMCKKCATEIETEEKEHGGEEESEDQSEVATEAIEQSEARKASGI